MDYIRIDGPGHLMVTWPGIRSGSEAVSLILVNLIIHS